MDGLCLRFTVLRQIEDHQAHVSHQEDFRHSSPDGKWLYSVDFFPHRLSQRIDNERDEIVKCSLALSGMLVN